MTTRVGTGRRRAGSFRRVFGGALVALAAAGGCGGGGGAPPERIVLVVVDALRRDQLSPYGGSANTPNIERLARSGVVYQNAYASFHMTTMSMGAIFSGHTPALSSGDPGRSVAWNADNWCGLARFGTGGGGACFPDAMPLLGEVIRDRGYTTIGVTSNTLMFRPAGFSRGFDQWLEVPDQGPGGRLALLRQTWKESAAKRSWPEVNAAVAAALALRKSDHFFLYVHYMDVHDWAAVNVPYRDTVEAVDRGIGELLGLLDGEGLLDGAVVILTSDHGESLGEQHLVPTTPRHLGNPSFEPVLAVPLIVSGAELPQDGPMIRSEDLFRTLLRLAGGSPQPESDLLPDELFVTEMAYRTYRRGRWKSYSGRFDGTFRLVDLATDPGERRDVAAENPAIAESHRSRVDDLTKQLAAADAPVHEVGTLQLDRLRALGYVE
jgi:arylsulfatase A-like enzyme